MAIPAYVKKARFPALQEFIPADVLVILTSFIGKPRDVPVDK
jgi:hypothetical protein